MDLLRGRIPRLFALFFLILFSQLPVLVNHFMRSMIDPDIWWHLRVGDWILQNHAFPHVGIFSQHAQDHSWMAYSWGFEVLMAWLFRLGGLAAIPLALAFFRAVIAFTLFSTLLKISGRFWTAWLLATFAMFPLASVLVMRPVLFSIFFFTVELGLIFAARRAGSIKPLYWLPLIFLVWANTHIQFVYGLAVLGLFVVCDLATRALNQERFAWMSIRPIGVPASRVLLILVASFVATLIGPYWGEVYLVILRYTRNTSQYNQISELVALAFRMYSDYFIVILLMVACFFVGRRRFDLFSSALLLISAMVSFRSNRDAWFLSLVACAIIAEGPATEVQLETRFVHWQYATALVLAIAAAFGYARNVGLTPDNLVGPIDEMYPVRATEFVRSHRLPGPIYNSFDWGGFLIFNLREYPVSIDGRNDFYGPRLFARMQNTTAGIDWRTDSDLAKANLVLIQKSEPLATVLASQSGYTLVYSDHVAAVFVRK